ncbi:MAG: LPS export ABC transporter ATP-binding protein [candidate division WOR-3 bacterium]|jgi:lipopolysaccharide export system ATP-binding protein|nr:LPS export ABC transporter ATP-binding protein [candidate division WOR-3 bacterium]MCR4424438.1 LPS export ABC transporter ATP-binding protein [candidate division WOR-3 bacterium]MDH7518256.1 LPS export ABC transporter ATP-binding protein [bacterium]
MKLIAEGLVKSYGGRKVVDQVSLELSRGEVVGLLGPNGAGKTTTFHMITGFIKPEEGKIFLDGTEITHMPVYKRARQGIGYLSQEPSVFRKLTVEENIRAILEMLGVPKAEQRRRVDELLEKLNITNLAQQRAGTLSGGERRRVELARALAPKPAFLLLDEPFTGVDPIVRAEIQKIVRMLCSEGLGILITDHNVRETLEITERAYLMYDAKVLISGTARELIENQRAREVYLGEKFQI